ncbi:MAG: hypothetical protein U5Q03_11565 [Bacteroidota bacterium]|nr:hypothetical protein [Bacteroidota bacterium]
MPLITSLSSAYIAPFFKIYSIINISDDISDNKSYFMEEILALSNLIQESRGKQRCLFIFDELFKGTNTIDRMASSVAVLSYLSKNKDTILLSTHDIELTAFYKHSWVIFPRPLGRIK